MSNFTEICPVGAALILAGRKTDRQTDMMKLIGAFHDYTKAPKTLRTPSTLPISGSKSTTLRDGQHQSKRAETYVAMWTDGS